MEQKVTRDVGMHSSLSPLLNTHCSLQKILEFFLQLLNINRMNDLCDFDLQFFSRCRIMDKNLVFHIAPLEEITWCILIVSKKNFFF